MLSGNMGEGDHERDFSWPHTNDDSRQRCAEVVLKYMANASRSIFVRVAMCPMSEGSSERWVRSL